MRIAFVVADTAAQSPTYGTLYLARAAIRRGHEVLFVGVDELTFSPKGRVLARAVRPTGTPQATVQLAADLAASAAKPERGGEIHPPARPDEGGAQTGSAGRGGGIHSPARPDEGGAQTGSAGRGGGIHSPVRIEEVDLSACDAVFLRYNPARDVQNGATPSPAAKVNPAVEFGWRLRLGGTLVINDPEGVQRAGGRMYLSSLPREIRPRTLITRSDDAVKRFLRQLGGPAIIKPLSGGGVENVFYVERRRNPNLNQILNTVKKFGYLIVQEYIPEAREGDKRLLVLNGRPIRQGGRVAIYRRVRPGETPDARPGAATARAERKPCEFGEEEQRIVDLVRPKLIADGLYFVGMDIVGGRVLEINVHTPGGLHSNSELYGLDVGDVVVRDLERRVAVRAAYGAAALPHVL